MTTTPTTNAPRRVLVANESRAPLFLLCAVRDGWSDPTPLGDARSTSLELPPGRYALQLGDSGHRVPLPLPAAELGYVPPPITLVQVWPWPLPLAGYCWIPAGSALRGDDLGVGQEDERPPSTPDGAGFWLAAHETTNAEYAAFLNASGTTFDAGWLDVDGPQCHVHRDASTGTFSTDAPDLPVVKVAFAGAVAYCDWLTRTTGLVHRLPTETEWEKAARGAGSRVYAYGDTSIARRANQESGRLREVGAFAPNEFGLFDMTGNAFEWTADAYRRDAYAQQADADAAPHEEFRVLRGGSFVLDGIFVRNSMRMRLRPGVQADDVGFRVLRENADATFGPVTTRGTPR